MDEPERVVLDRDQFDALAADRVALRQAQAVLTEVRASLAQVAVYEGLEGSPLVMMVSELVRDHGELERRIDAAIMECRAVSGESFEENLMAEKIQAILRGGGRVPSTPEGLMGA